MAPLRHDGKDTGRLKAIDVGVLLMKLSAIRERMGHDKAASDVDIRQPRNAEEAEAFFREGMRKIESRNDEAAFRIFEVLSRYEGDAPPHLVAIAKAGRDFLDPTRTAEQKARTAFDFFSPTLIHVRTLSIGRAVE